MQDITKIRQDLLIEAGLIHPEAIQFRFCVGIGEDYIEGLFEDHKGDFVWVNLGADFYH